MGSWRESGDHLAISQELAKISTHSGFDILSKGFAVLLSVKSNREVYWCGTGAPVYRIKPAELTLCSRAETIHNKSLISSDSLCGFFQEICVQPGDVFFRIIECLGKELDSAILGFASSRGQPKSHLCFDRSKRLKSFEVGKHGLAVVRSGVLLKDLWAVKNIGGGDGDLSEVLVVFGLESRRDGLNSVDVVS